MLLFMYMTLNQSNGVSLSFTILRIVKELVRKDQYMQMHWNGIIPENSWCMIVLTVLTITTDLTSSIGMLISFMFGIIMRTILLQVQLKNFSPAFLMMSA